MTSPYSTYAEKMATVAAEAEALADDMRAAKWIAPDAEGLTADTINAGFDNDADAMMAIANAAREASRVAYEQAPADAKFAAAPRESDVAEAYRAVQTAEERGAAPEEIRKARNHAANLAAEREDAKAEHAAMSRRTTSAFAAIKVAEVPLLDVPTPTVRRDTAGSANHTAGAPPRRSDQPQPSGNGSGGSIPLDTSSSSSTGGSPLSDTDAGTALSADGSGVPMTGQQLAGQPQPMGQQGAVNGQPQMQPMGQVGAVPSTGAGNLSTGTASRGKSKDDKKRTSDNGTPIAPTMAPMSFSNSGGGAVDRGSSTSGVTTAANTSGSLKTALSGAVVPPGTGQSPGMMARGGGMMGGMGGAGTGGAGGAGATKERPTIYDAHRHDETERSDSIQNGTLSRETAEDPNAVEERERQK